VKISIWRWRRRRHENRKQSNKRSKRRGNEKAAASMKAEKQHRKAAINDGMAKGGVSGVA